MKVFLFNQWPSVACIALLGVGLLLLLRKGYQKQAHQIVFYLVTQAEEQYGAGTGPLKFAAVSTWLWERLPAVARLLFTQRQLDAMIVQAVERMKGYLAHHSQLSPKKPGQEGQG